MPETHVAFVRSGGGLRAPTSRIRGALDGMLWGLPSSNRYRIDIVDLPRPDLNPGDATTAFSSPSIHQPALDAVAWPDFGLEHCFVEFQRHRWESHPGLEAGLAFNGPRAIAGFADAERRWARGEHLGSIRREQPD